MTIEQKRRLLEYIKNAPDTWLNNGSVRPIVYMKRVLQAVLDDPSGLNELVIEISKQKIAGTLDDFNI